MGMVRVSEDAENRIKAMAAREGKTFTATVDSLLAATDISARLDKMGKWLEKRFEDLEANILAESAASSYTPRKASRASKAAFLPWENCIQDIYDDFPEGSDVWLSGVREAWGEADSMDMASYFVKNGEIWSNFYGHETPLLRITPELSEYLDGKGFPLS